MRPPQPWAIQAWMPFRKASDGGAFQNSKSAGLSWLQRLWYVHKSTSTPVRFVGKPYNGEHNEINYRAVTPEFFSTIHARLLSGRFLAETDDASKPHVAIVNKALVEKYGDALVCVRDRCYLLSMRSFLNHNP